MVPSEGLRLLVIGKERPQSRSEGQDIPEAKLGDLTPPLVVERVSRFANRLLEVGDLVLDRGRRSLIRRAAASASKSSPRLCALKKSTPLMIALTWLLF